jgi:hypothetical protein
MLGKIKIIGEEDGYKKKGDRIKIRPRLNPISYEKPN